MDEYGYDEELAMWNAYFFLVGELTMDDIMESGDTGVEFPFNPMEYTKEEVQEVIDWFAQLDKFEECIELKKKKEAQFK